MRAQKTPKPEFRPLEEADIIEIYSLQSECLPELAELFDNKPLWAQLTLEQLKEKIVEEQKKPHTVLFAIHHDESFIGIAEWSANWDSWSPYAWTIIWPEFRRKGLGTAVAKALLGKSFLENPGHAVVAVSADWNRPTIQFIKSLGFKEIGKMRHTHMLAGEHHDTLFYDMLKSEYLSKEARK